MNKGVAVKSDVEVSIKKNIERELDIYNILQSYRIQKGLVLKVKSIQEEAIQLLDELELLTRMNDKLRKLYATQF